MCAAASDYPNRPVTMIVPYPAGGVTDLAARALADAMEKHLKQPVVVMNKVGGATTMGGYALATAKPDGYTLGFLPRCTHHSRSIRVFPGSTVHEQGSETDKRRHNTGIRNCGKRRCTVESFEDLVEYAKKNPEHQGGHRRQANTAVYVYELPQQNG